MKQTNRALTQLNMQINTYSVTFLFAPIHHSHYLVLLVAPVSLHVVYLGFSNMSSMCNCNCSDSAQSQIPMTMYSLIILAFISP